jgi:hypothetical protein
VHCRSRPAPRSPWQNPFVERLIGTLQHFQLSSFNVGKQDVNQPYAMFF